MARPQCGTPPCVVRFSGCELQLGYSNFKTIYMVPILAHFSNSKELMSLIE
jgi:hypothetical protein